MKHMLPNDADEFELRLNAGGFDEAIARLLTETRRDEYESPIPETPGPDVMDDVLPKLLQRGKNLGRSRLWVAKDFPASRLLDGMAGGTGEAALRFEGGGPPEQFKGGAEAASVTALAVIRFGPTLYLRVDEDIAGTPLDLVVVARPVVTRNEFDELIGFEKPRARLDEVSVTADTHRHAEVTGKNVRSLEIALPDEGASRKDPPAPLATFNVAVLHASSQLLVSSPYLAGESGILLATVRFDDELPVPIILETSDDSPHVLQGTLPLPPHFRHGNEQAAIVIIHEVTTAELPLLSATCTNIWLAEQDTIAVPLTKNLQGYDFILNPVFESFLSKYPDAQIAVRVASFEVEAAR